jgi:tRNA dimethylallyltransferase
VALRFPIIIGPTAGGKTALAVDVALRVNAGALGGHARFAEVISADSMLLYRGLDIGSAKPTMDERRGIPHHLIDVVDPTESFSVSQWLARAEACIGDIRARGGLPIVVGGTHLYVKALLDGLFEGPGADETLRNELRGLSQAERRAELERVDADAAGRIHANDERRTIRALEVFRITGTPISKLQRQWDRDDSPRDRFLMGLEWSSESINPRINARVRAMMDAGLLNEVRGLHEGGKFGPQSREALGYKQLIAHLEGGCSLEDAVEEIKIETRRFAKNQRTWMRRLRMTPGALWIDAESLNGPLEWTERVAEWSKQVLGAVLKP